MSQQRQKKKRWSHTLVKLLNEKVQRLFTAWASLELPTCNEDDCGLFSSAAVLWTFRGRRAQSVDSDRSSSQPNARYLLATPVILHAHTSHARIREIRRVRCDEASALRPDMVKTYVALK